MASARLLSEFGARPRSGTQDERFRAVTLDEGTRQWESGNRSTVQGETFVLTLSLPIPSVPLQ